MKIEIPFLRTENNYDRNKASIESGLKCLDESKTKQSFKEETDINTIVRNFGLTGELPNRNMRPPQYGDYSEVVDFKTAMDAVAAADQAFMQLPAQMRKRFGNDPQELLEFLENDENRAEAEKLGLVPKKVAEGPPGPVTTSKELVQDGEKGSQEPPKGGGTAPKPAK